MSTQSYLLSPSNRLSSGGGESGGSHETNILVVTTPPSLRSSAAASHYSPSSTRSPFSFDPAPSPPQSPHVHRISSSSTGVSSPLDRARHALRLSGENLSLKQEQQQQKELQLQQMQRETGNGENEYREEDEEGQLQMQNIKQPLTTASADALTSPSMDVDNQRLSPHPPARPRPSTSGARVGAAAHEYSLADRGLAQVGTGGAVGASGAGALPPPHIPEIRGESAATARVLLQVIRAVVFLQMYFVCAC